MASSYEELLARQPIRLRDDIYAAPDPNGSQGHFRLDEEIRSQWKKRISPRFATLEDAIGFGRRVLDGSGAWALTKAEKTLEGEWLRDWRRAKELAEAADWHATRLRSWMQDGAGVNASLLQMASTDGADAGVAVQSAKQASEALDAAIALFRRFGSFAANEAGSFAGRQNPGEPVLAEFVFRMAEGWTALTGKAPGSGTLVSKNPFLRFAQAGWIDLGGEPPSSPKGSGTFAPSALKSAIQSLELDPAVSRPNYRPDWA